MMTTIYAEQLLKMIAWTPGRFAIGEMYPVVDFVSMSGSVLLPSQLAWRTIWAGNSLYTFSTVAENMFVSSSSAADVGRILFVDGLDGQFNQIIGYGITNGQNQSVVTTLPGAGTPLQFFRINHVYDVTPALARGTAAGNLYVAKTSTLTAGVPLIADTRAIIVQGESLSSAVVYTTPRRRAFFPGLAVVSQLGSQQIRVRYRLGTMLLQNSTLIYQPTISVPFAALSPTIHSINIQPTSPVVPEMTDILFDAIGTSPVSGSATLAVVGSLIDYTYIKNLRLGGQLSI